MRASGKGASSRSLAASASTGRLVNRSKVWNVASSPIWARTASATSVRPWPMLQYQSPAMASTYSRPSSSHTRAPSPRTMVMKASASAAGLAKGCRKGDFMP